MAGVRYVLALALRTQRWAPPAMVLVGLITWVWISPPLNIDTVKFVALLLFALAAWLGYATFTSEDPGQEAVTVSCYGSYPKLVLARWFSAFGVAAPFPLLLLIGSYSLHLLRGDPTPEVLGAAALLLTSAAACGAAVGALMGALLPTHPGWAASLLFIITLSQAAPLVPPVGLGDGALSLTGPPQWPQLIVATGLGLAAGTAALLGAARWRSKGKPAKAEDEQLIAAH